MQAEKLILNNTAIVPPTPATQQAPSAYEKIDQATLEYLRKKHAWITEPLFKASEAVKKMPFFIWLDELEFPQEFAECAKQLFHHSATFPKVMGLMLASTPMTENHMMPFYAEHAFGEADHHELLMQWMLQHSIIQQRSDIDDVIVTTETNACINQAYQLAIEQDRAKWVLTINCGIERCSNDFFKAVAPKMHALGAGDNYFDIHVEADEFHSIMGLEHVQPLSADSVRGRHLIAKALEGVSLWASMLHSWIGINYHPRFDIKGNLVKT